MKRHGDLWEKIVDPNNLQEAFRKARKGKGWQLSVRMFELNEAHNLLMLQKKLCTGEFKTSAYRSKTIYEPKMREIYKLPFNPDRIVQHALLQVVSPIWDNLMIYDSYACRKGKGMHEASRKTSRYVKQYKYCFKADMKKFYPSINHDIMFAIVKRKIKCKRTLALLEDIIRSFPGGHNAPIGNYTSQWLGNLYMDVIDQRIKHHRKIKAYIRYCDDFVIFSNDKKQLATIQKDIKEILHSQLKLKFSHWAIFPVTQGVDFLGYRHFPDKVLLRKSTAKRVKQRLKGLVKKYIRRKLTHEQCRSSIASTEGWLQWSNSYNLRRTLLLTEIKEVLVC